MNDVDITQYQAQLTQLGIEYEVLKHPAIRDFRDVLGTLNEMYQMSLSPADCIPVLVMKADDDYLAIAIRGDCKVDFKKVKKQLSIKNLRMATPNEFTNLTGLPVGAARVHMPGLQTILDEKIFNKVDLMGGSGTFTQSIRYYTQNLQNLPDSRVLDVTKGCY